MTLSDCHFYVAYTMMDRKIFRIIQVDLSNSHLIQDNHQFEPWPSLKDMYDRCSMTDNFYCKISSTTYNIMNPHIAITQLQQSSPYGQFCFIFTLPHSCFHQPASHWFILMPPSLTGLI